MRVLQAITSGESGGAQSHVLALCRELTAQLDLVVAIGSATGSSALGNELAQVPVCTSHLQRMRNSVLPWRLQAAARELTGVIQRTRPDVVHAHSSFAGAAARIAARRTGVPAVYTVHGFGFKREARTPARQAAWLTESLLAPFTDRMICVSRHEAELARRLPLPADRVVVVPNGLPDVAERSNPGKDPAGIVMVSRLAHPKRPDLLLQAAALLAHGTGVQLIGDGPMRPSLESQARTLGLEGVSFTGGVKDVALRLAGQSIFVLLSDHEGLPISVIEAMRAGMAIVATDLPGVAEMVTHEESALLVQNDPAQIAAALARLRADASLRMRLAAAARARYEQEFKASLMAERVLHVYRSVLAADEIGR